MTKWTEWKRDRPGGAVARLEVVADAIAGLAAARLCVLDRIEREGWTEEVNAIEVSLAVTIGDLMALESRIGVRGRR